MADETKEKLFLDEEGAKVLADEACNYTDQKLSDIEKGEGSEEIESIKTRISKLELLNHQFQQGGLVENSLEMVAGDSKALGMLSIAEGFQTEAAGTASHTLGIATRTNNDGEMAAGVLNLPSTQHLSEEDDIDDPMQSLNEFCGSPDSTLFTVGNGSTSSNERHNALDIRQNGSILIPDIINNPDTPFYQLPMMNLQQVIAVLFEEIKAQQFRMDVLVSTHPYRENRLKGEFVFGTPAEECYVYVNGVKKMLPRIFDTYITEDITSFGPSQLEGAFSPALKKIEHFPKLLSKVKKLDCIFAACTELESVNLDLSQATEVSSVNAMFYLCESLKSVDLSTLNGNKIATANIAFAGCTSLTDVKLWTLEEQTVSSNYLQLFRGCTALKKASFAGMNFSQTVSFDSCFVDCINLTALDLSNITGSSFSGVTSMFENCTNIRMINVAYAQSAVSLLNRSTLFNFSPLGEIDFYINSSTDSDWAFSAFQGCKGFIDSRVFEEYYNEM